MVVFHSYVSLLEGNDPMFIHPHEWFIMITPLTIYNLGSDSVAASRVGKRSVTQLRRKLYLHNITLLTYIYIYYIRYIRIYIYILDMHIYILNIYAYIHTNIYTHTCMHACMHACIHTYIHIYTRHQSMKTCIVNMKLVDKLSL